MLRNRVHTDIPHDSETYLIQHCGADHPRVSERVQAVGLWEHIAAQRTQCRGEQRLIGIGERSVDRVLGVESPLC